MKENTKRNLTKIIVLVVALIVLAVSATYAYFAAVISGTPSQTTLSAGNLKIETNLNSASAINNPQLQLINASDKSTKAETVSFYVKNTSSSTVSAKYYIYLKDISLSSNLRSKYLKWELLRGTTSVATGTFVNATSSTTQIQLNTTALNIAKNTTDNLVFRLWLENDASTNQTSLMNGSFSGKLYLEATPVSVNQ